MQFHKNLFLKCGKEPIITRPLKDFKNCARSHAAILDNT